MDVPSLKPEAVLAEDPAVREAELEKAVSAPEHLRSALAAKLAIVARDATGALAELADEGVETRSHAARLERACGGLAVLRVETAKSALFRVADEGTGRAKACLARALHGAETAEGRAALVYLLSDEEARADALAAIAARPWTEVLPDLIEVAEAETHELSATLALRAIACCGASHGVDERNAAADFLFEQLDDDTMLGGAVSALLRFGAAFPGVSDQGKRLAREPGLRKIAGLCLVAAAGVEGNADLVELALAGPKADTDVARAFLAGLLTDEEEHVRRAAERTQRALDLR